MQEVEKKDSMIFYRSFYESINDLPAKNQLEIYKAIFEMAFNSQEIKLSGMSKTIFTLIEPQLKANKRRHTNGFKGGRPTKKITTGYELEKPNKNDNKNKNENDNKNENALDNSDLLNQVVSYFNKESNQKAKPYPLLSDNLNKLIELNYTIDDFYLVINFVCNDDWYIKNNAVTLQVIFNTEINSKTGNIKFADRLAHALAKPQPKEYQRLIHFDDEDNLWQWLGCEWGCIGRVGLYDKSFYLDEKNGYTIKDNMQ